MSFLQTLAEESPLSAQLLITVIIVTSSCSHNASLSFVSSSAEATPPSAWRPLPWSPYPPLSTTISLEGSLQYCLPQEVMTVPLSVVRASLVGSGGALFQPLWWQWSYCYTTTPSKHISCIFCVFIRVSHHPVVIMTTLSLLLHFETFFSYLNISKIRMFWK